VMRRSERTCTNDVRLQLILFSKITGAFLFRTFGGFLHVPATEIYCLTGAIISETRIRNIYLNILYDPPQWVSFNIDPLFGGAFKGTVSRDFLLLVFFLNQFPPSL
jgi:hypothetical protein